jgi:hypothetical protein
MDHIENLLDRVLSYLEFLCVKDCLRLSVNFQKDELIRDQARDQAFDQAIS